MKSYTTSAFWASATYISTIASMFVRNILFARLLSPDDFSIALTFGLVLLLFEYVSNFGHEILMQRSKDGYISNFQATMHSAMILRGIVIALIIIALAPLIPKLLNIHTDTFNYALLAIVPVINGFAHLDNKRAHRTNNYKPSAKIGIISDASSIVVALICVALLQSYWAFYVSFVFRHSISTLLSHWYSIRPYRLALNFTYLKRLWSFGLPLITVGLLKCLGTEADKVLIARYAGLSDFAIYFLALMVTANAANVISVGLAKIFVRRISIASLKDLGNAAFENGVVSLYLVLPILFTITVMGSHVIFLVFGPQYQIESLLFPAVVTLVAIRHLNHWLNQIVVGNSDTKLMLYADLIKVGSLVALVPFAINYESLKIFALIFSVAEVIYFLSLTYLLSNKVTDIVRSSIILLFVTTTSLVIFTANHWMTFDSSFWFKLANTTLGIAIMLSLFFACSAQCRIQTLQLFRYLAIAIKRI